MGEETNDFDEYDDADPLPDWAFIMLVIVLCFCLHGCLCGGF